MEDKCPKCGETLLTKKLGHPLKETLKHEMAHQYVSEFLDVIEKTSHGPVFRAVCSERGICGAASGDFEGSTEEETEIMELILKLHKLAESTTSEAEQETALRQAAAISRKYGISELKESAEVWSAEIVGIETARVTSHRKLLSSLICRNFKVQGIWINTRGRNRALELVGRPNDVAIAGATHDWLLLAALSSWKRERRTKTYSHGREAFLSAFMRERAAILQSEEQRLNKESGMVLIRNDENLKHFYHARYPRTASLSRSDISYNEAARNAGVRAAKNVGQVPGFLNKDKSSGPKLLEKYTK